VCPKYLLGVSNSIFGILPLSIRFHKDSSNRDGWNVYRVRTQCPSQIESFYSNGQNLDRSSCGLYSRFGFPGRFTGKFTFKREGNAKRPVMVSTAHQGKASTSEPIVIHSGPSRFTSKPDKVDAFPSQDIGSQKNDLQNRVGMMST
jgi:hypothetical protein